MAIAPFTDRAEVDVGNSVTVISASAGMDTSGFDKARQGVSVRDFSDFRCKLIPYISSKGIPDKTSARFDHTIDKLNFGQPKLFEDLGKKQSAKFLPFDDINDYNPVSFLNDNGTAAYPDVLLSPNWLDPGMLDGSIEPLAIRTKINNTSNEGPFVAHDIRGAVMPNAGPEIASRTVFILNFIEFEPTSKIPPYFDSQDIGNKDDSGFFLSLPGYDFPEEVSINPYVDQQIFQNADFSNDLSGSYSQSFTDGLSYGVYGKSTTTGFQMRDGSYVTTKGVTGNQRVNGVDSIAFGGLLK